jgi:hypothetical protein
MKRLAIVLVALPLSCALAEPTPRGHACDVHIGDTVYHLPVAAYLMSAGPCNVTTNHVAAHFSLILPGLDPASDDPAEVANWGKGTGWHRELHILVEYIKDYNFASQQQLIDDAFAVSEEAMATTNNTLLRIPNQLRNFRTSNILIERYMKHCRMGAESM